MQKHREEDRNRPFDLPMGGLLSELLASEGIDGSEIAAAEIPRRNPPQPARLETPPAPAPSLPDEPVIALPGLLSDLISLASAADADQSLTVFSYAPQEREAPIEQQGTERVDDSAAAEPHALAIPSLLSLLTAKLVEPAEAECFPETGRVDDAQAGEAAESGTHDMVCEEPLLAAAEPGAGDASGLSAPIACEEPVVETASMGQESLAETQIACAGTNAQEGPVTEPPAFLEETAELVHDVSKSAVAEPAAEAEPEYSPADAAAALAEAAGQLLMEASARSGASPQHALADLMGSIGAASSAGMAGQPPSPPDSCERYVVFQLGEQACGLHITDVREVEKVGRVTPVPGAPPMIRGLINLHGEILPLIDPRPLLGMPSSESASGSHLVVVHRGGQQGAVAWQVDGLGGMALVDPARVTSARQDGQADAMTGGPATGWASHRGRRLLLLDGGVATEESVEQAADGQTVTPEVGL